MGQNVDVYQYRPELVLSDRGDLRRSKAVRPCSKLRLLYEFHQDCPNEDDRSGNKIAYTTISALLPYLVGYRTLANRNTVVQPCKRPPARFEQSEDDECGCEGEGDEEGEYPEEAEHHGCGHEQEIGCAGEMLGLFCLSFRPCREGLMGWRPGVS
ncbi:hypothetical protein CALVIDRAFT_104838 [Calocera viscosa TUFC12733]|uniref:Uncharacterized protein n=1 Tax=Calocera viscosa (strain TUFC12733) TaxID=1330018 RepID=A0A167MPM1_CALVF|nr:hypothetical protein CALVIDRAFT_104838 [Calocera viscosa TUFC12733]